MASKIGQEIMGYGMDMKKKFADQKSSKAAPTRLTSKVNGNGKGKASGQGH